MSVTTHEDAGLEAAPSSIGETLDESVAAAPALGRAHSRTLGLAGACCS